MGHNYAPQIPDMVTAGPSDCWHVATKAEVGIKDKTQIQGSFGWCGLQTQKINWEHDKVLVSLSLVPDEEESLPSLIYVRT